MTTLKSVWNIISATVLALIVFCTVLLIGFRFMGYTVISGDMESGCSGGDLFCVRKIPLDEVKVKDFVVARKEASVVTIYRVIKIDPEKRYFYTGVHANDTENLHYVDFQDVIGILRFAVPNFGYVADVFRISSSTYILIGAGVIWMFFTCLPNIIGNKKKEKVKEANVVRVVIGSSADENSGHLSSGELAQFHAAKENEKIK